MTAMTYGQMLDAVRDARETIDRGDHAARTIAPMLRDRLRVAGVDSYTLKVLKRELREFDAVTCEWKIPK